MKKITNYISVFGVLCFGALVIGATSPYTFNTLTTTGTAVFPNVSVDGGSITLNAGGRIDTTSLNVSDNMVLLNADGSASFANGAATIATDGQISIGGGNIELHATGLILLPFGQLAADGSVTHANGKFSISDLGETTVSAKATVGGTLKVDTTTTGNIGAGEDDLISYPIPANTLANDGEYIGFDCWGTFAATATLKDLKVYLDTDAFLDTTSLLLNGKAWRTHGKIVRTDSSHATITCEFTLGGTLLSAVNGTIATTFASNPGDFTSTAFVFKVTGQDNGGSPADNAVVQNAMVLKWYPAQ